MKIFSSLILSLCSVWSFSQTILYQAESTSRTVQDPQSVVLAQGFRATSDVSNPFIAKIGPATENPGGGPTDSNAGVNNPSGTTAPSGKSFHDTKGNIEVAGGGQLQFTLPIALPPGVKSVAPQINLVYSSDSGNGIAGYGWSISGITSISRTGKNIEKDGEVKSIQIDFSDYYSFNGERLILKSGEYGKDGAEYITEKYSNIKIKSFGTMSNWKQPQYWQVTFEDGSQAWYGGTESNWNNAANRLGFSIVKWMDAQGNVINYTYDQLENISIIKSITWGGNEKLGTASFNEILFDYNDRNIPESSYINGPGTLFTQTKILKDITVKTNGQIFKKYVPEYITDTTGYQYVKTITESNSKGEPANPVVFDYPAQSPATSSGWDLNSQALFDKLKFTGDFNGDAYLDFVMTDGTIKLGVFNDDFNVIQTNKIFNSTAVVVNTFIDETGKVFNGNGVAEYEKGKISVYAFRNNTFVKVFEKLIYDESTCTKGSPAPAGCRLTAKLNEGDVNGDGISDVFVNIETEECQWVYDPNCVNKVSNETTNRPPPCTTLECYNYTAANIIVDLKNQNNPASFYTLDNGINESSYYDQKYMDVDNDGKIDIINISNTAYTVFEFVKTTPNNYLKKIKFAGNLEETKGNGFPVLFGDFNGDGKLDFTLPLTEGKVGKDDWKFYLGTGKSFNTAFKPNFLMYKNEATQNNGAWLKFSRTMYSVSDLNADGKSDIVQVHSYSNLLTSNSRTIGSTVNGVISKGSPTFGAIDFITQNILSFPTPPSFNIYQPYDDLSIHQPITNVIRSNNNYYSVFLFRKENVIKIKAPTGVDELKRIQSITQGGITTSAKYQEIVPDNTINPNFYKNTKSELYPYFSLNRIDRGYAVAQLQQEGRKQDFRYRGMTVHMQGRGMIGYYQTARSSWFADGFENTKVWSGAEINIEKEGLPAKEWSIRTTDESKIFPADISENNTELLSFKSTIYRKDEMLNGQVVTAPVSDVDKPKVVTAIVPETTKTKDFLTNVVTTSTVTYGEYYLPTQTVSNVNNGYGITTSVSEYTHNPSGTGSDYFVGRLKSKTDIVQAYGDTQSNKEEYTYDNNLLKTMKTWNRDNTAYLQENYFYDGFGNITKNIINNSLDSQTKTTQSVYDPKGRFVLKKTDNLGLETNIEYSDWGQIKKQIDALGNTIVNTYDNWGKLLTSKANLGGTTTYQYERDGNSNIFITQYNPDGNIIKKYTNRLGQEYKTSTKAFAQGQFVSKDVQFDILGRKINESELYFEGQSVSQWNSISYDDSVFPARIKATAFTGKQTETTVSGLTVNITEINPADYGRSTSKTSDALGNVISSKDKGGVIVFSYNAAGEQIKSQYAENIVTTKYDSWGRKSEYNDPSNGIYKYEYNGFGQPQKTISPKGTKEYVYNDLGQLISQKELSTADGGQATNKNISYTYDNKGRVISKTGTSKGKGYSSNVVYDPQGRLLSTSESNNGKYFIKKGITYDDKGKVSSYEKQLYSSGVITKVNIENVYNAWSGDLYQVKDKNSGKILWQLKNTNAKGQVLQAKLGAVEVNQSYENDGTLSQVNHSSAVKPGILQLSYNFNAIKNELEARTTGGDFNITESFDYDDNNRLVNWSNPVTGVKVQNATRNVYDVKGRIVQNDQVGTIKFENSSKIYQPTGMTLNAAGTQNYNNDLIQSIAYNENNDPIFIDGMKGDVSFQYGLTSMRQLVSYGGNFDPDQDGKFTKYYSEDGSFEILKDNVTGKEKHSLYIGGNPYESDIVFIKNYTESNGSYKFLHKDYLGSILAISDEAGNKLEQRHFDAWGNLTHLQIGNGPVMTDKNAIDATSLLVDRGYTGHEHFAEVGIIHMNGRLYDPLLRRFLNADENIQDIYNTQNYNKYGYVLNNPLMFNDPSGEFAFAPFIALIAKAAFSAIAITAATYTATALIKGNWSVNGFFRSLSSAAITGMISGALSFGIGTLFQIASIAKAVGPVGVVLGRAGAHAISMGVISTFSGGSFWSGAASGAFASLTGDLLKAPSDALFDFNPLRSDAGLIITGAISGGVGSVLAGGNFWQGAMNGFFVAGFNHVMHRMEINWDAGKRRLTEEEIELIGKNYPTYDKYPDALSVYEEVGGALYKEYLKDPSKYINTCAIRMSVAFEKSNIDIGGDYNGINGKKYYTSATRFYEAINARFISFNGGPDMRQYGIIIQFLDQYKPQGKVYHVDIIFKNNGNARVGHEYYKPHYNKFY